MKKVILFLLILFLKTSYAGTINEMVIFGDSLSDNGNLHHYLSFIPKTPPYFQGQFTNGPVWADIVGAYYAKHQIRYQNYAVGGSTAYLHSPLNGALPLELSEEIFDYLVRSKSDRSNTLFVIWMGANDYLDELNQSEDALSAAVVNKIIENVTHLMNKGARYFVVFGMPNLARTPYTYTQSEAIAHRYENVSKLHNQKILEAINTFQLQHPNIIITFLDVYPIFSDILDHPEKYNEKYHLHLKNMADSCWKGGYFLQKNTALKKWLVEDLQKQYKNIDAESAAKFILNSPSLAEAYKESKSYEMGSATPCEQPDEYVFWDGVHPSRVIHQILADMIITKFNESLLPLEKIND